MPSYQNPHDMTLVPQVRRLVPIEYAGFMELHKAAFRSGGLIGEKARHLIAVGVAVSTKCAYCIEAHTREAARLGATREEIAEACMVSAAVCAGGAATHALLAQKLYPAEEALT